MHPKNLCSPDILWEKGSPQSGEGGEGQAPSWELLGRPRWTSSPRKAPGTCGLSPACALGSAGDREELTPFSELHLHLFFLHPDNKCLGSAYSMPDTQPPAVHGAELSSSLPLSWPKSPGCSSSFLPGPPHHPLWPPTVHSLFCSQRGPTRPCS